MKTYKEILTEKFPFIKYLKEVGINAKEFKKNNPDGFKKFQKLYSKYSVTDFETQYGYLDAMEDESNKIKI